MNIKRFLIAVVTLVGLGMPVVAVQLNVGFGSRHGLDVATGVVIGSVISDESRSDGPVVLTHLDRVEAIADYYTPKMADYFEIPKLQKEISVIMNFLEPSRKWSSHLVYSDIPFSVAATPNSVFISSGMLQLITNYDELSFVVALAAASVDNGLFSLGSDATNQECRLPKGELRTHDNRFQTRQDTRYLPQSEQFAHTFAGLCWADYRVFSSVYYRERQRLAITNIALRNLAKLGINPEVGYAFLVRRQLLLEGNYYSVTPKDDYLDDQIE
ncbi:MAG: hypothetical protein O3A01_04030, partial [bacterium]|nr:hypothetical protein [bacterium]